MIKGILIDPTRRIIDWVDVKEGYQGTNDVLKCEISQCVQLDDLNDIWVDEEYHYKDGLDWFTLPNINPVKNRGLILGFDEEGNCSDCTLSLDYVKKHVRFMDSFEVVMKTKLGVFV